VITYKNNNGCTVTATVTVNALPICNITGTSSVFSGSIYTYTSTPVPADNGTHSWSIAGNGTITSVTTNATVDVTAGTAGTFTLTDSITRFGCTSSCTFDVTVISPCSISPVLGSVTNGTSTTYSAPVGMDTYTWTISGNGTIISGTASSTVTVLAGNACTSYTISLSMVKNGVTSSCLQTVTVTDNMPPTFTAPGLFDFCVENLFSASYVSSSLQINPAPDYYLFRSSTGSTIFDLINIVDNCCALNNIRWEIVFSTGEPTISGTGQPSTYNIAGVPTDIKLWGDGVNFTSPVHVIRYWVKDCNNNENPIPLVRDITVNSRPNITKKP